MNPLLAGVALAVIAGSVAAASTRDARTAILALAVTLVLSPLVADPLASPIGLAARLVGAVLASYLLWIAVRGGSTVGGARAETDGSRIGWPAEALVAGAAAVTGFAAHGLGAPALGPAMASAAGFAVAAVAVVPIITGRDAIRLGVGLMLLIDAALLVRAALGGTPGDLEQLLTAGLIAALGGALATATIAAHAEGAGGFELSLEPRRRRRHEPDAHPIEPR